MIIFICSFTYQLNSLSYFIIQLMNLQQVDTSVLKNLSSFLFEKRLQFYCSQSLLQARKQSYEVPEDLFFSSKKNDASPICQIKSFDDLQQIYKVFNALVQYCRFNARNLDQSFNKSRNQLRGKKILKEIDKHCKTKLKKCLQLDKCTEDEQEQWKMVFNHKNIAKIIHKIQVLLKAFILNNFQLIKQGAALIKNNNHPKQLQIQICVTAIDILQLISSIKYGFLPNYFQPNNASKVQIEQKSMLQSTLQAEYQDGQLQIVINLDSLRFYAAIRQISTQMQTQSGSLVKLWLSVEQIRLNYLFEKNGTRKRKYDHNVCGYLCLYWQQVYNQHFNRSVKQTPSMINMNTVFCQYKYMSCLFFKKEETKSVVEYLDLVQNIFVKIDKKSATRLFWEELSEASKRILLPNEFMSKSKPLIIQILQGMVEEFQQKQNSIFLTKLKDFINTLSVNLISLEFDEDIIDDYFLKQEKDIRLLLTQRNAINEVLSQIQNLLSNQKQVDLFSTIKKVTQKIQVSISDPLYLLDPKFEKEVLESIGEIYQYESELVAEITYFMRLSKILTQAHPNITELQECKQFYSAKRRKFVDADNKLNPSAFSNPYFSLQNSIQSVTYEFIIDIKLNKQSSQLDRSKKLIYKLLKIYEQKRRAFIAQNKIISQDQNEQSINAVLLRRASSGSEFDPSKYQIAEEQLQNLDISDEKYDDFTMRFLKKIFSLRIQMIIRNIDYLEESENNLRKEFVQIKRRIYQFIATNEKDALLKQSVKILPDIQFDFIKQRYFQAWNEVKRLHDIEGVNKVLQKSWDGKRNILKLYINAFIKYRQPLFQASIRDYALQNNRIQSLIKECFEQQHCNIRVEGKLKQNMINSIRILDSIEKVAQLRKELIQQDQQMNIIEQAKQYKTVNEKLRFRQLEGRLQIHNIMKNENTIMRKYVITPHPSQVQEVFKKLKRLAQFNRNITLDINRAKDTIIMKVDEFQSSFDSYPKLVKHLIESYVQTIQFCFKQLHIDLYPLLLNTHFKTSKKNDHSVFLRVYPYEGILLNILIPFKEIKIANQYRYPQFPFLEFADQLSEKFQKQKIYERKNIQLAQTNAFFHLIEQMKALSMQLQGKSLIQIAKSILKCPFFWSSADKLFQIVQFKERYQSLINIQQGRRKQNEKVRQQLTQEQKLSFTYWPIQKKHPLYKPAYGYHKTDQIYFSIEGLVQKQAFLEDIGNFKGKDKNLKYKYHGYRWHEDKPQIKRLIDMVSEREKKRGSKTSFYDKTFNSFQNHIRNLRNLSVHYIYDNEQKKQIQLEQKLTIFETYFPKLFVFLYRWRPFLGKDFSNQIKLQKIHLLKQLFSQEQNSEIIDKLENIKDLQDYNLKNSYSKNYLLNLFGYDFARINGCEPCKILCNSFKKQASLWGVLADIKRENYKEGKDMTYNLLFWEHQAKACNGMKNILLAYFNVTQRNNFTAEEFSNVKSSLTLMKVERDRLNVKIQRIQEKKAKRINNREISDKDQEEDEECRSDTDSSQNLNRKQPVEKRFQNLSSKQEDKLYSELVKLDYVSKYFIYELEIKFPYLFHDLRKQRYQWDERATSYPQRQ